MHSVKKNDFVPTSRNLFIIHKKEPVMPEKSGLLAIILGFLMEQKQAIFELLHLLAYAIVGAFIKIALKPERTFWLNFTFFLAAVMTGMLVGYACHSAKMSEMVQVGASAICSTASREIYEGISKGVATYLKSKFKS